MSPRQERLILPVIFLFCFAIRMAYLDQKNLWFDEVFSWNITLGSFYEIIVRTTNDIHPPLYYFILKIWIFLFGDSIYTMRLLSAVCTSLAIFFIYGISKRFLSDSFKFIPLILHCISPLNLYYSQEVRMAGLNLLFNIAAVYYFIRLLEENKGLKELFKNPVFIFFILFESAALYTHYFSFFILIAEVIFLIIYYKNSFKNYKPFILAYGIIAAIYLIWIPALIEHFKRGQGWRQKQSFGEVTAEVVNYLKDISMGLYYHFADYDLVQQVKWFLIIYALTILLISFIKPVQKLKINYPLLIGLCFIVPLLLAVLISFNQRIEFYRYLSILVPYACIYIVFALSKIKLKPVSVSMIILFASVNIYGMYQHYKFDFKNDDYRQIIKDLNSSYREGEKIYVQPHYCGWILNYTRKQGNLKIPNFVDHRYGWNVLLDSLKTQNPAQFWLIMDYSDVDTSHYSNYVQEIKSSYTEVSEKVYPISPARVEVYRFSRK